MGIQVPAPVGFITPEQPGQCYPWTWAIGSLSLQRAKLPAVLQEHNRIGSRNPTTYVRCTITVIWRLDLCCQIDCCHLSLCIKPLLQPHNPTQLKSTIDSSQFIWTLVVCNSMVAAYRCPKLLLYRPLRQVNTYDRQKPVARSY